jgi:Ala-tRNA(Pro) deacylase
MVVDDSLLSDGDVWFEAGDHEQLVHVAARSFRELLEGCRHGRFGTTH